MALFLVLFGALGAAVGSFINVVVYRVPAGRSVVRPPSACPACGKPVRWFDNIPVISWVALRGRCRDCAEPISRRYPIVEAVTALAFVGVTALFAERMLSARDPFETTGAVLALVAHLYLAAISIALTLIDLDTHRLPNVIVLPSYLVAIALLGTAALLTGDAESAATAAIGGASLFAVYFVLAFIAPHGMGMGDVKLAGVLGMYLGWAGWGAVAVGALGAFVLGGLVGLLLIIARRARRDTRIPFGPWMLAGAWLGIVAGEWIAEWYLALFGLS